MNRIGSQKQATFACQPKARHPPFGHAAIRVSQQCACEVPANNRDPQGFHKQSSPRWLPRCGSNRDRPFSGLMSLADQLNAYSILAFSCLGLVAHYLKSSVQVRDPAHALVHLQDGNTA